MFNRHAVRITLTLSKLQLQNQPAENLLSLESYKKWACASAGEKKATVVLQVRLLLENKQDNPYPNPSPSIKTGIQLLVTLYSAKNLQSRTLFKAPKHATNKIKKPIKIAGPKRVHNNEVPFH